MKCEQCGRLTPITENTAKGLCPECDSDQFTKDKQIKQLQAALDKHRWIPVSESPELFDIPHPHSKEVSITGVPDIYTGWFEKDRGWRHGDGTVEVFPTHWKPIHLPEKE